MSQQKILIVEDDPVIIISLEFLMAQNGFDVFLSKTGADVLDKIAVHHPQLILMDVMLPYRTGLEICQLIRADEKQRQLKIILLSAKGRTVDINKGLSLGADAYITKPFSTKELLKTVNDLLKSDS